MPGIFQADYVPSWFVIDCVRKYLTKRISADSDCSVWDHILNSFATPHSRKGKQAMATLVMHAHRIRRLFEAVIWQRDCC